MTNVFCDGLKYITINMKEYGVSVITSVPLLLEAMQGNGCSESIPYDHQGR